MVFDLIDMMTTIHDRQQAANRMAASRADDARMIYDSATGEARDVVFIRRGASDGT